MGETKKIEIAYLYDKLHKERLNKQGENFWFEYIKEVFCQMGVWGKEIAPGVLKDEEKMDELKALFINDTNVEHYGIDVVKNIDDWIAKGGILIGFKTKGLDNIFGNIYQSEIKQVDDFTISGYFSFKKHKLTEGIHSFVCPSQKLLIFSDIRAVTTNQSKEIAKLYVEKDAEAFASAITINNYGKGFAVYFSFDVARTFWVLHQGRPVYKNPDNIWLRTSQKSVIEDNSSKVGYTDEILFLLQNIIALTKYPFVYQIPPKDGKIPAALFHWGGDDEGDNSGIQIKASNWMKEKELPYHINVMEVANKKIPLTKEDAAEIIKNGHEISCHYNFTIYDGKQKKRDGSSLLKATEFEVKRQSKLFEDKFGLKPLAGATHCLIWYGGCEPAKWMAEVGGIANNGYISSGPAFNGSNLSFGFGTSYPYYFYDDAKNKNKRINFMEIPITAYELGHKASSGGDKMEIDSAEVYMAVDIASYYHLVFNMFYHPYYIYNESGARKAIEGFLDYINRKGITVVHMGTNAVAKWWNERAKSKISNITYYKHTLSFDASCSYKEGMIIKIPVDDGKVVSLRIDNQDSKFEEKREFGYKWLYFICPYGSHKIKLNFN